jgi:hypothetical protein
MRNAYKIFVGKRDVRRSLGRNVLKWGNNIKMALKGTGCKDVVWCSVWFKRGF